MKQTLRASAEQRSLAETQTEGFRWSVPEDVQSGRGCVLQIYPATAQAEMILLNDRRTLIGRELSCGITLDDNVVSRIHAAIDLEGSSYSIVHLGSRNGTFVDDKLLRSQRRLHGGEHIRIGGTILKFMASMDEEAQYHAVVQELMTLDPLTNVYNRSFLMSTLEKLLSRCQFTTHSVSVIMIDIDYFKRVNDSYGHLIGDEVLRLFSERVRNVLRPDDVLCRLGGEEFVVLSERTRLGDAAGIAERIRLTVASAPFSTQGGPIAITCSLGVMTADEANVCKVDELLSRADELMYAAKSSGRNCVRSPLNR